MPRLPLVAAVLMSAVVAASAGGCGAGGGPTPADQSYLDEVHQSAPDIGRYRSDTDLVRLGHAVCDDLASGASYLAIADRLTVASGSDTLPAADLGAVITFAAQNFCPRYRNDV